MLPLAHQPRSRECPESFLVDGDTGELLFKGRCRAIATRLTELPEGEHTVEQVEQVAHLTPARIAQAKRRDQRSSAA